ncbi:MAG: hypothetical protein KatS3mg076_1965 [Candidatus Binatia bacterium]|nr:MAG: hypothetical protein KatS3mg076_1965 [Candidatus Binatia bacterium]
MFPWFAPGCLALALLALFFFLFPFFFVDAMLSALAKLGMSPEVSLLVLLGIFVGGLVDIPVRRIPRDEWVEVVPVSLFGLHRVWPRLVRRRTYTVLAVNVGGCVVPSLVALYETFRMLALGPRAFAALLVAVALNVWACHRVARPVPNLGVLMPPFVPAVLAAGSGLLLYREYAPSIAFAAGVFGPLVGADLLNLREVVRTARGGASIGGAGTFDGIVLSGLVATLLA